MKKIIVFCLVWLGIVISAVGMEGNNENLQGQRVEESNKNISDYHSVMGRLESIKTYINHELSKKKISKKIINIRHILKDSIDNDAILDLLNYYQVLTILKLKAHQEVMSEKDVLVFIIKWVNRDIGRAGDTKDNEINRMMLERKPDLASLIKFIDLSKMSLTYLNTIVLPLATKIDPQLEVRIKNAINESRKAANIENDAPSAFNVKFHCLKTANLDKWLYSQSVYMLGHNFSLSARKVTLENDDQFSLQIYLRATAPIQNDILLSLNCRAIIGVEFPQGNINNILTRNLYFDDPSGVKGLIVPQDLLVQILPSDEITFHVIFEPAGEDVRQFFSRGLTRRLKLNEIIEILNSPMLKSESEQALFGHFIKWISKKENINNRAHFKQFLKCILFNKMSQNYIDNVVIPTVIKMAPELEEFIRAMAKSSTESDRGVREIDPNSQRHDMKVTYKDVKDFKPGEESYSSPVMFYGYEMRVCIEVKEDERSEIQRSFSVRATGPLSDQILKFNLPVMVAFTIDNQTFSFSCFLTGSADHQGIRLPNDEKMNELFSRDTLEVIVHFTFLGDEGNNRTDN
jgi:hypothetical protein